LASDTAPLRAGEELNLNSLAEYLRGHIEGAEDGITVEQFPNGHSNLTYLLRTNKNNREYVLRRGPLGPVAPKAHDMAREFRLLESLHPHFPEAPAVFILCQEPEVLGSVFYLMERHHGIILRDSIPPQLAALPNYQEMISETCVDCLARLHAIDIVKTGLVALGKPEGFLARQLHGWADRWHRASNNDRAPGSRRDMDRVLRWLADQMPASPAATLIHNDYKLDNIMLRPESPSCVEAVLDWEMATVGDPLADIGAALCYWAWAQAPQLDSSAPLALTMQPGWYTRDEFIQRYAQRTGRDLSHIAYYEVFGIFKLAVILQQIYYRYEQGQTSDSRFQNFDIRVRALGELAIKLLERLT
jgi:aminoglycoside phosphotransferase (APT) family kinase protein